MGLDRRIQLLFAVALISTFLFIAWTIDAGLRSDLDEEVRNELRDAAVLLAHGIGEQPFSDALADRLAAGTSLRVTLIDPDGIVLGDSDVPARRLRNVPNHADRPEVSRALAGAEGIDARSSETVSRQLLYLAVPHEQGVLRVSRSTEAERSVLARVRGILILGALLTLLLTYGLGRTYGRMRARTLGSIRQTAEALAAGDLSHRNRSTDPGPLGDLGRAIDDLADRIEDVVTDYRQEQADLDALFDSLEDGVAVLNSDQIIVRANRAFREIMALKRIDRDRLPALTRSLDVRDAAERGVAGEAVNIETHLGDRIVLVSSVAHGDGALLVLKDLTAFRRLESVRRDFVGNVSHELKTPLTTVMGFAEPIAEADTGPAEAREFGRRILHNAQRMRRLVEDLLDLSRIEAGSWRPAPEEIELGAAARDVWASLRPDPKGAGTELVVEPEEPIYGIADLGALRQILRNLLENAARYAPEGSDVVVGFEVREDGLRAAVTDSGPGIPPVHQERVFERFYRVDPARSRQEGGTGLGLAIVKHLVAAQGGEVGLESDIGTGTTVWFGIPTQREPQASIAFTGRSAADA